MRLKNRQGHREAISGADSVETQPSGIQVWGSVRQSFATVEVVALEAELTAVTAVGVDRR
jgi:hypothetical protein